MQKTKHWLMTIAVLLCSLAANAHDFEVGGIYYNITSSSDLTVAVTFRGEMFTDYDYWYEGSVSIPSTVSYNNRIYKVTAIGGFAFFGCEYLSYVTIPEGVTSIGDHAFDHCYSLSSVTIPEGVTVIGFAAFINCGGLSSITIPNTVTTIADYAFSGCSSLTSITIPEGVTSIGSYAFDNCSSLTTITIPENSQLMSIGDFAFYGCTGELIVNCDIPDEAFRYSGFTKVVIGESVTSIGDYAFSYCSGLTTITIPEGVTSIGDYAFAGCSSLTSITIP